ncbi:hypothetical protein GCM10025298_24940 [Natronobiforma cellulositropha]
MNRTETTRQWTNAAETTRGRSLERRGRRNTSTKATRPYALWLHTWLPLTRRLRSLQVDAREREAGQETTPAGTRVRATEESEQVNDQAETSVATTPISSKNPITTEATPTAAAV